MNVKEKTIKLSDAYKAIDEAKGILRDLENLADKSAFGELLDLADVVSHVYALRDQTDKVLIGFVESQIVKQG